MAKHLYLYRGGEMKSTPEEQQAVMAEWQAWFETMGSKVVDMGAPFQGSKWVKTEGVTDGTMSADSVTGYSIVEATSFDEAAEWAKTCPNLKDGGSVEVMDPMPMPGM